MGRLHSMIYIDSNDTRRDGERRRLLVTAQIARHQYSILPPDTWPHGVIGPFLLNMHNWRYPGKGFGVMLCAVMVGTW